MNSFLNIIFFFLLSIPVLFAQPLNRNTPDKTLMAAEQAAAASNYFTALEKYEELYSSTKSKDIAIKMADLNYKLRDYSKAAALYAQFFVDENEKGEPGKRFDYGRTLKMLGKYNEAIAQFDIFLGGLAAENTVALARNEKAGAIAAMKAEPDDLVTVSNVGSNLNTKNSEYSAVLSSDGNLYYSSLVEPEIKALDDSNRESFGAKILVSKENNGGFDRPRTLGMNINRPGYFTSNVTISADGNEMIFARQLLSGGNEIKESKLFRSVKGTDGWGAAQPLETINSSNIVKSPSFGNLYGKPVLFFASNKPGGYGGYDIYYADYIGENKYAEARNLGPVINGLADEDTPFYRDGRLFFSSNSHPGMGGYDIFSSDWNAQKWSTPNNLGLPFNSSVDDLYFMLNESGNLGFLVSNRPDPNAQSLKGSTCCNDIYKVVIEKIEVGLLAKTIDNSSGMDIKGATVSLVPKSNDGKIPTQEKSNPDGNEFNFSLDLNTKYWVIAAAKGYESDTLEISTNKIAATTSFERKLNLNPILPPPPPPPAPTYTTVTTEKVFVLENILYDYNDDKITSSAEQDLNLLLGLMKEHPTMVIELSSHTDSRGPAAYNQKLSQRRAESARDWLVAKGIAADRIVAKGHGFNQPKLVDEKLFGKYPFLTLGTKLTDTVIGKIDKKENQELAHQANRRTEFKIISGPTSIKIEEKKLIEKK